MGQRGYGRAESAASAGSVLPRDSPDVNSRSSISRSAESPCKGSSRRVPEEDADGVDFF